MCGSQYSSLLKRSENIKGKFEDSLDCLCVRGTSASWSVAPRRVISALHITVPTPRVYFCKKVTKNTHMWNSFAKMAKLQKLRPVAPQPGGQARPPRCRATGLQGPARKYFRKSFSQKPLPPRSGATRSQPPGSGAAGVYSCKFRKRKYIFVKKRK